MTADPRCYGGSYSPTIPQLQSNALDAQNPRNITRYIPSDPRSNVQSSDPVLGADGRCYGPFREESLTPNPLDSSNPIQITLVTPPAAESSGAPTYQSPADNPANRCYGPIPLPNSVDRGTSPDLPTPPSAPPSNEDIDPRAVIRSLVGRCYPPRATDDSGIRQPDVDIPTPSIPSLQTDPPIDMICDMFPYLPFCPECEKYATDPRTCTEFPLGLPPIGGGIFPPTLGTGDKNCDKLWQFQRDNLVTDLGDGNWERTDTKERFYCPPEQSNSGWAACVEDALECLFKPYVDGAWKPPSQDCVTFYPRGYNGNVKSFCIANCFPNRVGIYEYVKGKGAILAFKPYGSGLHNLLGVTTNYDGTWNGNKIENPGGNSIWNTTSTKTYTATIGSATVTLTVEPFLDGGEYDSNWYATYTGTLPAVGTEASATFTGDLASFNVALMVIEGNAAGTNHDYGTSSTAPSGYTLTSSQPVFYLHERKKDDRSVPVYKYYSSATVDTFLTTNPGQPDAEGEGERATMNASQQGFVEILGYAYEDPAAMAPYLTSVEKGMALHRYLDRIKTPNTVVFSGNNIVVAGGSVDFTIEWSWKDTYNSAGVCLDSFTIDNRTFTRNNNYTGRQTERFTNIGVGSYPISFQNLNSRNSPLADRIYNGGKSICLFDDLHDDCNGTIRISNISKANSGITEDHDHYYTIRKQTVLEPPTKASNRNYYLIPNDVSNVIVMNIDVEKGGAGYRNTLFAYIETDGVPRWAQLLVVDATNQTGMSQHTIPITILQQYKGGNLGFALVSNGAQLNSYNVGDTFTSFSQLSDGWRITGIASAESNYTLFSNDALNPRGSVSDSRDYTVWKGDHWQWWEDLIGGDSDFDDCKFWHEVIWAGGSTTYEGIQCYVWENDSPTPVTKPMLTKNDCDPRLFKTSFKDVMLMRSDCGSLVVDVTGNSSDVGCGKCIGEYLFQVNRTQKSTILHTGKFSLRSMGGITQGLSGDCIVFVLQLSVNGSAVWEGKFKAGEWPEIGKKLHTEEFFSVVKDDVVKFKVTEIKRGPTVGNVTPRIAILDEESYLFESTFSMRLQTQDGDARSIPYPSTVNPEAESSKGVGGAITGFDMCYIHNNEDRHKNAEIEESQKWYKVWENSAAVNTDATYNNTTNYTKYQTWTNRKGSVIRGWDGTDRNSYIDTYGFHTDDKSQHFNLLLTRMLFKDGKTGPQYIDGVNAPNDVKRHIQTQTHYARLQKYASDSFAWYESKMNGFAEDADTQWMVDNLYNGMQQNPEVNTRLEPGYFIQDYWLIPEDDENQEDHGIGANTAKIRVGITFWAKNEGYGTGSRRTTNFYATIELLEVLDYGDGYGEGQEFVFYWPPKYTDRITDYSTANSVSPFSPTLDPHRSVSGSYNPVSKLIPAEIAINYEPGGRGYRDTKRPVYDAYYQESHNRESMYWFIDKKEYKDRVKFKVRINGVQ